MGFANGVEQEHTFCGKAVGGSYSVLIFKKPCIIIVVKIEMYLKYRVKNTKVCGKTTIGGPRRIRSECINE